MMLEVASWCMQRPDLAASIAMIVVISIGGVALPLWLSGNGRWDAVVIDHLTYLTGGVFLGAGMVHMLPEAAAEAQLVGYDSPLLNPFTTFCAGFLLVFAIEQMQHQQ